ncbi:MAG: hypothetical protein JWM57_159, partial [Phycisphaerales bacterium]|nr:hypothetical protein [Phycisphaerales bacterium]
WDLFQQERNVDDGEWKQMWDARKGALESALGPADDGVFTAMPPFYLGGAADVLPFSQHVPGRMFATCGLLGEESQKPNIIGTYELAIAHRDDSSWGPNIISRLARYTCDAELQPGQTMSIGTAVPAKSTIAAFFFDDYRRFKFEGIDAGLVLCIGLTADELDACQNGRRQEVYDALKAAGVYPYTDLFRPSVLKPKKGGLWNRLTGGA